jgi:hypothetical protein
MKKLLVFVLLCPLVSFADKQYVPNALSTEEVQNLFLKCEKTTGAKRINFKAGEKPSPTDQKKMTFCLQKEGVIPKDEPNNKK